jgi:hypothetical protein
MVDLACPYCGRPLYMDRIGVRLPPLKAAILDAVRAAGDLGATAETIIARAYERRRYPQRNAIKAHIWQINELLEDTEYRIVCEQWHWRLERRRKQKGNMK